MLRNKFVNTPIFDCLFTVLAPSNVAGLTAKDETSDSITFEWLTGAGRADGFELVFSDPAAVSCKC